MPPDEMPSELRLLLTLMQRQRSPDGQARVTAWLEAGGRPDHLYALAKAHGLLMLLYRGLVVLRDKPAALAGLTARLEQELTESAVRYEFIYPGQLAVLLAALEQAGVEHLVLKGFVLGQTVYGQPVLRSYGDFDLLVPEAQLETAEQALISLGYRYDESQSSRAWYRAHHHHLAPLVHPSNLPVEIHWGLATPGGNIAVNMEAVWQHAQPLYVNDVVTRTLCPEHLLVYLCIHAVHTHLFEMGLKPLCDIQEALVTYGDALNWEVVIETCQQWRCQRHVYLLLRLLGMVFGVGLPEAVLRRLSQQGIDPSLLEYCLANILNTAVAGLPESSGLVQVWQESHSVRRLRLAVQRLLPSRETVATEYQLPADSAKVWFYYPRWQWMMLRRHFKTAWQLIRNNPAVLAEAQRELVRRDLLAWLDS